MNHFTLAALSLAWLAILVGGWLGWQLLRQNGRLLLRVEELEKRLDELEFGESDGPQSEEVSVSELDVGSQNPAEDQSLVTSTATNGDGHANRFGKRSLAKSRIKRDGLKAGTPAPDFRLTRLDGRGKLSLSELRNKRVLLVFSDPHCSPCKALAPELERFHREHPEMELVMISRGEPSENRAKVKEHELTFPVVMQQQWEISRRYAMFATPIAYLINETGIIEKDVAVGVEPILALINEISHHTQARELALAEPTAADSGLRTASPIFEACQTEQNVHTFR